MPGADTEDSISGLPSSAGLTSSNNPGSAKIGSRPKHKRQDQVQQLSYNHSRYLKCNQFLMKLTLFFILFSIYHYTNVTIFQCIAKELFFFHAKQPIS